MSDFLAYGLLSLVQGIKPALESFFDETPGEFDSFQDVLALYRGGLKVPKAVLDTITENVPPETLEEIFSIKGGEFIKYPLPDVIKGILPTHTIQPVLFLRWYLLYNLTIQKIAHLFFQ